MLRPQLDLALEYQRHGVQLGHLVQVWCIPNFNRNRTWGFLMKTRVWHGWCLAVSEKIKAGGFRTMLLGNLGCTAVKNWKERVSGWRLYHPDAAPNSNRTTVSENGWYTGIPYTQKKYDDKPSRYIGYPLFRQADIIIVHTSTCKNWVNVPAWSIRSFLFGCLGKPDFVESEVVALLETVEHGVQACYSLNGLVLRKIYRKNMVLPSK